MNEPATCKLKLRVNLVSDSMQLRILQTIRIAADTGPRTSRPGEMARSHHIVQIGPPSRKAACSWHSW